MIAPDIEAMVAEEEQKHVFFPKDMLRAFLRIYHEKHNHVAWLTPSSLLALCRNAAVESAKDAPRDELTQTINNLWAHLANRYTQEPDHPSPPYSTEVICGYVQEMLDADS